METYGFRQYKFRKSETGRIDVYYDRKFKQSDGIEDFTAFLVDAAETISLRSRSPIVNLKSEINPETLEIGNRKNSPNCLRVYKKSNGKFIS